MSNRLRKLATVAIAVLVLSACAPEKSLDPLSTTSPTTPASVTSPSPTPTASSSASLESQKMDKSCADIFPLGRLYEFDPNVALVSSKEPASALATQQLKLGGIICELTNLSSATSTQIVVSKLTPPSAEALKSQIQSASNTSGYQVATGTRAAFQDKTGQFVFNNYWVSVTSDGFTNPVLASPVSYLTSRGL